MEKFNEVMGTIILILLVLAFAAFITAWPVQLLWNSLMTDLFGLRRISFWEALGLQILCGFLFKSYSTKSNKD